MILGTTADFTTHGIMADSTTHGSTAAITILGTMEDSTTHGITADSTDRTTTDGTEDGIRSGLDIIRDITLHLTIMAKMYGEALDMRPVQTESLQAAHPQEADSVRQRLHEEMWLQVLPRPFPEHQQQAVQQREGLQSEQLRQQGHHQQYEVQQDRAIQQLRPEQRLRQQEATTADLFRQQLQEAQRLTEPAYQAQQEAA